MYIHAFPIPEAVHRLGRDLESIPTIGFLQGFPCPSMDRNERRGDGQGGTIRSVKDVAQGNPAFYPNPAFVDRPMVGTAEQVEIPCVT
jgi:hypothetical protein